MYRNIKFFETPEELNKHLETFGAPMGNDNAAKDHVSGGGSSTVSSGGGRNPAYEADIQHGTAITVSKGADSQTKANVVTINKTNQDTADAYIAKHGEAMMADYKKAHDAWWSNKPKHVNINNPKWTEYDNKVTAWAKTEPRPPAMGAAQRAQAKIDSANRWDALRNSY